MLVKGIDAVFLNEFWKVEVANDDDDDDEVEVELVVTVALVLALALAVAVAVAAEDEPLVANAVGLEVGNADEAFEMGITKGFKERGIEELAN
jgi:hypothetical protein